MRAEKAMSLLRLCYYNLKSLKLLYFVPIAVLFPVSYTHLTLPTIA